MFYSNISWKVIPQCGTAIKETVTNIIGATLKKSQLHFTISQSITIVVSLRKINLFEISSALNKTLS